MARRTARGPELTSTATAVPDWSTVQSMIFSSVQYRERAHPGHRPDQAAPDQDAEDFVDALVIEVGGVGRCRVVVAEPQRAALLLVLRGDPPAGEVGDGGTGAVAGGVQRVSRSAGHAQV